MTLTSRPTFRVVGIELGDHERTATSAHVASRLAKALQTGRRLASLTVPAAVSSSMWRTTVLPQGLYGSEIRHVTPAQLRPLCMQGKNLVTQKLLGPWTIGGHQDHDDAKRALRCTSYNDLAMAEFTRCARTSIMAVANNGQ